MAMKLGIYLNSQHPAGDDPARRFDETLEQVRLVRSLGFDSIWAGEHHITPGFHFFPQLPLLHRLAGEAEGLWIGTNVTLLPLHNPVELAEAGAFLDVITGGKFLLGVGLGYRPEEYQIYGVPMSERVSRFTEAVEILGPTGFGSMRPSRRQGITASTSSAHKMLSSALTRTYSDGEFAPRLLSASANTCRAACLLSGCTASPRSSTGTSAPLVAAPSRMGIRECRGRVVPRQRG